MMISIINGNQELCKNRNRGSLVWDSADLLGFHSSRFPLKNMSGCGSGCSCGSNCSCGSDCKCGKRRNRYSEFSYLEESTTQSVILGIAPEKMFHEESEMSFQGENGCKCGSNCTCDPCTCK